MKMKIKKKRTLNKILSDEENDVMTNGIVLYEVSRKYPGFRIKKTLYFLEL